MWPWRWLLLCSALSGSCSRSAPPTYRAEYLLADHLSNVVVAGRDATPAAPSVELGFDRRRAITQHPPSDYRFPSVPNPPGAVFRAAPAMSPKVWALETDGVDFEIRCRTDNDDWRTLLSKTVSPVSNPDDRSWIDVESGLEPCSTPTTEISLVTSCRGDCSYDWAMWGDPRVHYHRTVEPRPARLVLLVSIDTLRPDRMSLYGAQRRTTPELERLANDALVFTEALASAPWTIPSHATMLSSTYPRVHGARVNSPISHSVVLVSEAFRAAGWQTSAFVDSAFLGRSYGFDRGFDRYDDDPPPEGDFRRGARTTRQRLLDWLGEADERPAFIFWHIMDVHGPYGAPAPFGGAFRRLLPEPSSDERLARLRSLAYHDYLQLDRFSSVDDLAASYDEGISAVDDVLGGLLQTLRDIGVYDDASIVVTSDHGESFLDHEVWVGHGLFLTDDEVRVPLIVKLPGNRRSGERVTEMVRLLDVAPSILDAAGVAPPPTFQGQSLLGPREELPELVYGFSSNTGAGSIRTDRVKYISPGVPDSFPKHLKPHEGVSLNLDQLAAERLFDLVHDPAESSPLSGTEVSEELDLFRAMLARHADASRNRGGLDREPVAEPELSQEELERLRSLGYIR